MSWLVVGVSAGSLAKSELVDVPKEKRQRQLAASTQRYAPWTGLKANPIQEADPAAATMSGAVTGLGMKTNMQDAAAKDNLMNQQANWLKSNPYNYSTGSASAMAGPSLGNYNYGSPSTASLWGY